MPFSGQPSLVRLLLSISLQAIFFAECAVALHSPALRISADRLPAEEANVVAIRDFIETVAIGRDVKAGDGQGRPVAANGYWHAPAKPSLSFAAGHPDYSRRISFHGGSLPIRSPPIAS